MTNTKWRRDFEQQWFVKNGELSPESYLKMADFIQSTLDNALKDQKAELLEKMPKPATSEVDSDWHDGKVYGYNNCLNDCLEIIKGLIKGE